MCLFLAHWALMQRVPDGGLYAATPVDPLFILLPVLERHRQKVRLAKR